MYFTHHAHPIKFSLQYCIAARRGFFAARRLRRGNHCTTILHCFNIMHQKWVATLLLLAC